MKINHIHGIEFAIGTCRTDVAPFTVTHLLAVIIELIAVEVEILDGSSL